MSSLGGDDELDLNLNLQAMGSTAASIQRITLALRRQQPSRPSGLTREERLLWDTIQSALQQQQSQPQQQSQADDASSIATPIPAATPLTLTDETITTTTTTEQLQERLCTQEHNHSRSLRAIQRVLADVTHERDDIKLIKEDLQAQLQQQTLQLQEKTSALENAKMIITSLEQASGSLANDLRSKLKNKDELIQKMQLESMSKQKTMDALATQLRDLQRIHPPSVAASAAGSNSSSSSSGTSSGATTMSQPPPVSQFHSNVLQDVQQRLEQTVEELRTQAREMAATIGEDNSSNSNNSSSSSSSSSSEQSLLAAAIMPMTQLLNDSIAALTEATTDLSTLSEQASSSSSPSNNALSDPRRLHRELEDKTKQLQKMEENMKQMRQELQRFKDEEYSQQRWNSEQVESMRMEIDNLREQCQTNMTVLAKKERELATLRDSLKVDDGDVGYISDDASDATEDDEIETTSSVQQTGSMVKYGPSQAEALATLLSHNTRQLTLGSANNNNTNGSSTNTSNQEAMLKEIRILHDELHKARRDAERYQQQWRAETESLANAKMIISSLEKANKSMMEDLRSRLQDSNTAIASLLEKSMESEKTTNKLRRELERLRDEKDQEAEQYELQIKRLHSLSVAVSVDSSFDTATASSSLPSTSIDDNMSSSVNNNNNNTTSRYSSSVMMETID